MFTHEPTGIQRLAGTLITVPELRQCGRRWCRTLDGSRCLYDLEAGELILTQCSCWWVTELNSILELSAWLKTHVVGFKQVIIGWELQPTNGATMREMAWRPEMGTLGFWQFGRECNIAITGLPGITSLVQTVPRDWQGQDARLGLASQATRLSLPSDIRWRDANATVVGDLFKLVEDLQRTLKLLCGLEFELDLPTLPLVSGSLSERKE
jgi:hypothetical protein